MKSADLPLKYLELNLGQSIDVSYCGDLPIVKEFPNSVITTQRRRRVFHVGLEDDRDANKDTHSNLLCDACIVRNIRSVHRAYPSAPPFEIFPFRGDPLSSQLGPAFSAGTGLDDSQHRWLGTSEKNEGDSNGIQGVCLAAQCVFAFRSATITTTLWEAIQSGDRWDEAEQCYHFIHEKVVAELVNWAKLQENRRVIDPRNVVYATPKILERLKSLLTTVLTEVKHYLSSSHRNKEELNGFLGTVVGGYVVVLALSRSLLAEASLQNVCADYHVEIDALVDILAISSVSSFDLTCLRDHDGVSPFTWSSALMTHIRATVSLEVLWRIFELHVILARDPGMTPLCPSSMSLILRGTENHISPDAYLIQDILLDGKCKAEELKDRLIGLAFQLIEASNSTEYDRPLSRGHTDLNVDDSNPPYSEYLYRELTTILSFCCNTRGEESEEALTALERTFPSLTLHAIEGSHLLDAFSLSDLQTLLIRSHRTIHVDNAYVFRNLVMDLDPPRLKTVLGDLSFLALQTLLHSFNWNGTILHSDATLSIAVLRALRTKPAPSVDTFFILLRHARRWMLTMLREEHYRSLLLPFIYEDLEIPSSVNNLSAVLYHLQIWYQVGTEVTVAAQNRSVTNEQSNSVATASADRVLLEIVLGLPGPPLAATEWMTLEDAIKFWVLSFGCRLQEAMLIRSIRMEKSFDLESKPMHDPTPPDESTYAWACAAMLSTPWACRVLLKLFNSELRRMTEMDGIKGDPTCTMLEAALHEDVLQSMMVINETLEPFATNWATTNSIMAMHPFVQWSGRELKKLFDAFKDPDWCLPSMRVEELTAKHLVELLLREESEEKLQIPTTMGAEMTKDGEDLDNLTDLFRIHCRLLSRPIDQWTTRKRFVTRTSVAERGPPGRYTGTYNSDPAVVQDGRVETVEILACAFPIDFRMVQLTLIGNQCL